MKQRVPQEYANNYYQRDPRDRHYDNYQPNHDQNIPNDMFESAYPEENTEFYQNDAPNPAPKYPPYKKYPNNQYHPSNNQCCPPNHLAHPRKPQFGRPCGNGRGQRDCMQNPPFMTNRDQQYDMPNNKPRDNSISDEYLLEYLLMKYKLDKDKLVQSILKSHEHDNKLHVMWEFYKDNKFLIKQSKPLKDHYKVFKQWNCNRIDISREELEDYFDQYVRPNI
jgi:hypothetical protein